MLLVHLSDLHCGAETFSPKTLETAIREINALKPDAIVITGDITNMGIIDQYELAAKYIKKFKCDRVLMGSGNHDFDHTGFLLWDHFFPRPEMTTFENFMIGQLRTARPDRNTGEVGYRQLVWFEDLLKKHRDKFKIVALHHHLVPIPDTGSRQNIVLDAGDALRTLIGGEANLILCGHKHRPWKLNIENLTIVHAGTVSSRRFRGFFANSYNIIRIERGNIDAELKIVGGERVSFEKILKGYDALGQPHVHKLVQ
jgi:3',5'-cyclic AMP phosphodiesterase CpdA